MGIGTGTAALIGGVAAAGGSVASGAIGAHAAGKAADEQSQAAQQAAQLQYKASQDALNFQKQQYGTAQQQMQPWLQSGQAGLSNLDYLLGINPGAVQGYGGMQGAPSPSAGAPINGQSGLTPGGVAPGMRPQPMGVSAGMAGIPATGTGGIMGAAGMRPTAGAVQAGGLQQFNPATGTSGAVQPPAGQNLGSMVNPSLGGFGSLMQPFGEQFQAPTDITQQNDPGYQARLKLGTDALQRSAAARGNVLTGGTAKALDTYAQDYASNEYGNVYNRAYNEYANRYNMYNQNQQNQYNRLASLAGVGQTSAGQLGTLGQNASNAISSNLLGTAQNMGQAYQNAAAANASGIVGGANAWGGALGGVGSAIGGGLNNLTQMNMLKQLFGNNAGPGTGTLGSLGSGTLQGSLAASPFSYDYLSGLSGATGGKF